MIREIDNVAGPIHVSKYAERNSEKKPKYFQFEVEENAYGPD